MSGSEWELTSPFLTLTFEGPAPDHFWAITAVWSAFWLTVTVGLVYAYAVVLAGVLGFETTLLVGVAFIAVMAGGKA